MRGPEIYPPEAEARDTETAFVSRRTLRELAAGVGELLRFAEGMDMSDLGEEPEDLLFLRAAADRLSQLLGNQAEPRRVPGSRLLGLLDA